MTSSNTFQSDIGSFQNGGHGEDIIKARLELFMYNLSHFSFLGFSFFLFLPTDRPTFTRERNKPFYGDGQRECDLRSYTIFQLTAAKNKALILFCKTLIVIIVYT